MPCLQVVAFPSKSDGLFVPESLIFRSDSNGEDLAGYAGAGLYDSITMDQTVTRKVDYGSDRYVQPHWQQRRVMSIFWLLVWVLWFCTYKVHFRSAWEACHTSCGMCHRILTDEGFRQKLLTTVVEAGAAVEKALGSAQDIEGVIDENGELTVVQTRPQM
jgi:alpha-glucan, water dikinase